MKFQRTHLASILMAAAGAVADAASTSGGAPSTNVDAAAKPKRAPKNPENLLDIINGRLPMVLVYLIRFKETGTNGERAKKYGTSVGKVFDIVKGRNFGYLTDTYKPSAEEVAAGAEWLTRKTAKGNSLAEADVKAVTEAMKALGVATAEEVAARNWATRTVGVRKEPGTAPVAGVTAGAAAPAEGAKAAGTGAKLF